MSKPTALLEKPMVVEPPVRDLPREFRRGGTRDRIAIARTAVVVAWVLVATAIALAASALLVHQQAVELGLPDENAGGVLGLLTLGALALFASLAAAVAAVNQRPRGASGWVCLIASGAALLALLLGTLPVH